jgi:NADPH:quinone reductase-like Zn-dependent oxidoreductase
MLTRCTAATRGDSILVVGASGSVGTALLDLARHLGLKAIGTCSARNMAIVQSYGAQAIDYHTGDFVAKARELTDGRGVDAAFDAIGGAHFSRSFAALAKGGVLVGYGSQTMANGKEGLLAAGLGLARLKLWSIFSPLFGDRSAIWYAITDRRKARPSEFSADMAALFDLLGQRAIHPVVADRLPLSAAAEVHRRIETGGLGGKVVLLPW